MTRKNSNSRRHRNRDFATDPMSRSRDFDRRSLSFIEVGYRGSRAVTYDSHIRLVKRSDYVSAFNDKTELIFLLHRGSPRDSERLVIFPLDACSWVSDDGAGNYLICLEEPHAETGKDGE